MPTSTEQTHLAELALAIVLLPLAGFAIQVFFGKRIPPTRRQGDWVPTLCIFGSLALATYLLGLLLSSPHGIETQRWYPDAGRDWIRLGPESAGSFVLHIGILVDNLTVVMLFVVSMVSSLVHLYSWGYMRGEARYSRFFAFLGLFSFSMLGLCVTSNLLVFFIFWELVGVCSYFLIGFYFERRSAQEASIKAFLTTRVGDLGLLVAVLVIAAKVGSLEFSDIFASVARGEWDLPILTATALCLFLGPVGKSAQFPLHIWLPDAMEGPTPVSALIHAATMVAAGVYLVGRVFPFMAGAPYFQGDFMGSDALLIVGMVGGFTAFFAATIAFVQTDIKKVLAYSTVSQLGYMMLGVGTGSVSAALFHLTTHAFFKALLFLCAGSVIHGVHSNEIADMGGLRRKMPITWATFLIATLALTGLPFLLSGFYSKEAVLVQALTYAQHHRTLLAALPFGFGILTAGLTAFYMFRLYFAIFHGEPRNREAHHHAHESPWTMTVPLVTLGVLTVVAGGNYIPGLGAHWFEERVASAILVPTAVARMGGSVPHEGEHTVLLLSGVMFLLGLGLSSLFFCPGAPFYRRDVIAPGTLLERAHRFLCRLWYVDAILVGLAVGSVRLGAALIGAFDRYVIDGLVNAWGLLCRAVTAVVGFVDDSGVDGGVRGLGNASLWFGQKLRRLQTGYVQEYVTASVFLFTGLFVLSVLILALLRNV